MKINKGRIEILKDNPDLTNLNEESVEEFLNLPKKTRNDVLFLLKAGASGDLDHMIKLIETCKDNKIKINRLDEKMIESYCDFKITADEIIQEIRKKDMNRLTPQYYEAPCKISNPDAINKLKGNK